MIAKIILLKTLATIFLFWALILEKDRIFIIFL